MSALVSHLPFPLFPLEDSLLPTLAFFLLLTRRPRRLASFFFENTQSGGGGGGGGGYFYKAKGAKGFFLSRRYRVLPKIAQCIPKKRSLLLFRM